MCYIDRDAEGGQGMDQTANAESNPAQNGNTNKPRGESRVRASDLRGLLVDVSGYRGQACLLDFKFTYSRVVEILGTEFVLPQSVYPVVRHLQLCTIPTRSMGQDTNRVQGTAELKAITTNKLGIFQPKR